MTPTPEQVQREEAGHAAYCLTRGIPVRLISMLPSGSFAGWIEHVGLDVVRNYEDAQKFSELILCGWIHSVDSFEDLPSWPLSLSSSSQDECDLARVFKVAGWGEREYNRLIGRACAVSTEPVFESIYNTILGVSDHTPVLDTRHIKAMLGAVSKRFEEED